MGMELTSFSNQSWTASDACSRTEHGALQYRAFLGGQEELLCAFFDRDVSVFLFFFSERVHLICAAENFLASFSAAEPASASGRLFRPRAGSVATDPRRRARAVETEPLARSQKQRVSFSFFRNSSRFMSSEKRDIPS